jgi:phospholipid transport system substrate-binding protein
MSMARRRLLMLGIALPILACDSAFGAAAPGSPNGVIEQFYADLLAVMKQARQLSFDERYARLAPSVSRTFDLGLMSRIAVGPGWAQLSPSQQQRLAAAFTRYTISVYAKRFDDYGGERFDVGAAATPNANGVIVASSLVRPNGEKTELNYLLHQDGPTWKVIDVYLSGAVSELAARRSEFVSVLQRDGAEGLVQMIERRAAELRSG